MDRGPMNRGPMDRRPMDRGPMDRGPVNRGPMDRDGARPMAVPRRAVVVGAGIGGLAAARALQQAGWQVQVLERERRLQAIGAGISLWPNATRALEALGVPLVPPSVEPRGGGIRTSGGRWLSRTAPETYPARYGTPFRAVDRGALSQALLGSLTPDTLSTDEDVSGLVEHPDGVTVTSSGGDRSADLVVLADGVSSRSRPRVTGPGPRSRYAGYTAWRGIAAVADEPPAVDGAVEYWGRGQRFGIVPLTDGRSYWFATAGVPAGGRAEGSEHAEVLRRFARWHRAVTRVVLATPPADVLRSDVVHLHPAPATYVSGRMVLLADAAHAMTPDLGQGACQALEDAVTLGAVVASGLDLASALAMYDAQRRPRAHSIAHRSRLLGRIGQLRGPAASVRNVLLAATPTWVTDRQLDAVLSWQPGAGAGEPRSGGGA